MSICALGDHFDIDGGGSDLMFPHHENAIAQSEAATGKYFANVWMHNGPLRVNGEKMSKSLGNFFTIREVLKEHDAEAVRHLLIASHYRSPIDYSLENLAGSRNALERFYHCLKDLDIAGAKTLANNRFEKAFHAAMDDDFNTPEAFGVLFEMVSEINRQKKEDPDVANHLGALLVRLGSILGVLQADPTEFLRRGGGDEIDSDAIDALVAARDRARADRDW